MKQEPPHLSEIIARGQRASALWRGDGGDAEESLGDPPIAARTDHPEAERRNARGGGRPAPPGLAAAAGEPPTLAELRAAIGYVSPGVRAAELRDDRRARESLEREEQKARELARQRIREHLGEYTRESKKRFEQLKPDTERDRKDVERFGRHVWAICRMAAQGSLSDLAYAVSRMQTLVPHEAIGCFTVEAMGLTQADEGVAVRQMYSDKARRKLIRSFVLWVGGENTRLRQIAGSPSRRTVRGVRRVPQKLLARIAAIGGKPWSRSTTTRDANESHAAGLWRRARLPHALAHASERCGPSRQVVSRYWMELPRQPRMKRRTDPPVQLGGFFHTHRVVNDPLGWVREQGKQAIVYAMHAVALRRAAGRLSDRAIVVGMMAPLLHAPP